MITQKHLEVYINFNPALTFSTNCIIFGGGQAITFVIADTKWYVVFMALSTQ